MLKRWIDDRMDRISEAIGLVAGITLVGMASGLIGYSIYQVFAGSDAPGQTIGNRLLGGIGYVVVAIALIEVTKFFREEEALDGEEMRKVGEARRSLTRFVTIVTIAVFLEALVMVFQAGKGETLSNVIYPTLLLLAGVGMILGLGLFQRLSAGTEEKTGETE